MTQDDFKLYTGADASKYSAADWTKLVGIASARLASFLCLPNGLPNPLSNDLTMLLANFLEGMLKYQSGNEIVESKHVRNFTINFKTATANAFSDIADQYGDIIEQYSNCGIGFKVESGAHYGCERGCSCNG